MKVVFVAWYDVPDELERKVNEIGEALNQPTNYTERHNPTVCIADSADAVLNVISAVGGVIE